jgi:ankyrin repeat protein
MDSKKRKDDSEITDYERKRRQRETEKWSKGHEINRGLYVELGWSDFRVAINEGNLEIIMYLLDSGADINTVDARGQTPLHESCKQGKIEISRFLIKNQADINIRDVDGKTPLHSGISEMLIQGTDLAFFNNGYLKEIARLIDNDLLGSKTGWTPIYVAASNGHVELLKFLIERGDSVHTPNNLGCTPLQTASFDGNLKIINILIENGADVNKADVAGYSPLYTAANNGHLEAVKLLIEKGADINQLGNSGWTPLFSAAISGFPEIVKLMIDRENIVIDNLKDLVHYLQRLIHDSPEKHNSMLPIVKMLVENGCYFDPSQKIPIVMEAIGMIWKPVIHHLYSKKFRNQVKAVMMLRLKNNCIIRTVPKDVLFCVFSCLTL